MTAKPFLMRDKFLNHALLNAIFQVATIFFTLGLGANTVLADTYDDLPESDKEYVEQLCLPVQHTRGTPAYRNCLLDQSASLIPGKTSLNSVALSFDEQFAIQQICRPIGNAISTPYLKCASAQIESLNGISAPILSRLSEDEMYAVQQSCADEQSTRGVRAYRVCLNLQLSRIQAIESPDLSQLSLLKRNALQLGCSAGMVDAVGYRTCLLEGSKSAALADTSGKIADADSSDDSLADAPEATESDSQALETAEDTLVAADAETPAVSSESADASEISPETESATETEVANASESAETADTTELAETAESTATEESPSWHDRFTQGFKRNNTAEDATSDNSQTSQDADDASSIVADAGDEVAEMTDELADATATAETTVGAIEAAVESATTETQADATSVATQLLQESDDAANLAEAEVARTVDQATDDADTISETTADAIEETVESAETDNSTELSLASDNADAATQAVSDTADEIAANASTIAETTADEVDKTAESVETTSETVADATDTATEAAENAIAETDTEVVATDVTPDNLVDAATNPDTSEDSSQIDTLEENQPAEMAVFEDTPLTDAQPLVEQASEDSPMESPVAEDPAQPASTDEVNDTDASGVVVTPVADTDTPVRLDDSSKYEAAAILAKGKILLEKAKSEAIRLKGQVLMNVEKLPPEHRFAMYAGLVLPILLLIFWQATRGGDTAYEQRSATRSRRRKRSSSSSRHSSEAVPQQPDVQPPQSQKIQAEPAPAQLTEPEQLLRAASEEFSDEEGPVHHANIASLRQQASELLPVVEDQPSTALSELPDSDDINNQTQVIEPLPPMEQANMLSWLDQHAPEKRLTFAIEFMIYWMAYGDERYEPEMKRKIFSMRDPDDHDLIKRWVLMQDVDAFADSTNWLQNNTSSEQREQIISLLMALLVSENALTPAQNTLFRFLADAFGIGHEGLNALYLQSYGQQVPPLPRLDKPAWWNMQTTENMKRWDARSVARQPRDIQFRVKLGLPLTGELHPQDIDEHFVRAAARCRPQRFEQLTAQEQFLAKRQLVKIELARDTLIEISV